MARRNYQMTKRGAAVQETRGRIVDATLELHGEQGVGATSWEDIAARAGVGVGTVYRHFRSFDELLPACGALTWEKLRLPDRSIFDAATTRLQRLHALTGALFSLYERGENELRNIRQESSFHPVLAEGKLRVDEAIAVLVDAAVETNRDLVRALTDLGTWQSLQSCNVGDPARTIAVLLEKSFEDERSGSDKPAAGVSMRTARHR